MPFGARIRVVGVATDAGHADTSLLGRTGTVRRLFRPESHTYRQLWVRWDDSSSTLSLVAEDEIELIDEPVEGSFGESNQQLIDDGNVEW